MGNLKSIDIDIFKTTAWTSDTNGKGPLAVENWRSMRTWSNNRSLIFRQLGSSFASLAHLSPAWLIFRHEKSGSFHEIRVVGAIGCSKGVVYSKSTDKSVIGASS